MKKLDLPADIKKYIAKRRIKTIVYFLLTEILLFVALYITTANWRREDMNNFEFTALAMAVIPFFLFRIPQLFTDRTYKGEIISIGHKEENNVGGMRSNPFKKGNCRTVMHIETKSGKLYVAKLDHINSTGGPNGQIYKVGDKVLHVAGTDYPKIIRNHNTEYTTCVVCGSKNDTGRDKCEYCKHSLSLNA